MNAQALDLFPKESLVWINCIWMNRAQADKKYCTLCCCMVPLNR